jgi:hypothetical protein
MIEENKKRKEKEREMIMLQEKINKEEKKDDDEKMVSLSKKELEQIGQEGIEDLTTSSRNFRSRVNELTQLSLGK